MSREEPSLVGGRCTAADRADGAAVVVVTFPMPAGSVFDWHTHDAHQFAWAASGVLTVRTESTAWVLPPTRALWIPAGLRHETLSVGSAATMRTLYLQPERFAVGWPDPTPVAVTPLLAELIGYLGGYPDDAVVGGGYPGSGLGPQRRRNAEALLADLLQPTAMAAVDAATPADERAAEVAVALRADPADARTLAAWGRQVGASERTLARAFLAGTGLTFGRWRRLARLQAALPMLAAGDAVGRVALRVGYQTASAFVAAFRGETGVTPAAYFGGRDAAPVSGSSGAAASASGRPAGSAPSAPAATAAAPSAGSSGRRRPGP